MASSLGSSGGGSSSGGPGGNHGQPQALTDVTQIFDLLESNKPDVVQEVKDLILENLNSTKESWLVSGLYEYYIQSGSGRCSDILCGISREPHDKFLIERMTDGIKSPLKETRRQALVLVGHAVCKQPPWLYKITQQPYLFRELIKLLKTETDVVILLTGLLAMIMMLPIIPMFIVCNIQDIFDVFGRLATWTNTTHNIPREHLLHLQVGLYSLFHRLYAMFPCNFLSYLRHNFSTQDKRTVFVHTIMPMLEKVKMHPHLVTATKEGELNPARWRSRDYHDIISECSKISLDGYESSLPEEMPSGFSNLGSNTGNINERRIQNSTAELSLEDVLKIPNTTMFSQAMSTSDLNSLVNYIDDFSNTAPPTPLSVTTGSSSNVPMSHTGLTVRTNLPLPTETAMEATPENTPVKDRDRSHFKLPSYNTPAAIQLFGPEFVRHDRHDRPIPQTPPATPTNSSVPSSPLPVTSTLSRRDSIFDSSNFRRESLMLQRLQKVQLEQLQSTHVHAENLTTPAFGVPVPHLNQSVEQGTRKVAIVQPHTNVADGVVTAAVSAELLVRSDSTQESEKSTGGPLTPLPGHNSSATGPGLIDPDLSLITLDEEPVGLDECSNRTCVSGGLHMADHKSMVAFARKVNRLRYHSHCIAGSDFQTSLGPSPGTSPSSTSSSSVINARSRFMKRSMSCPDIKKPIIEDKDGKTPKLPEVSEVNSGLEDKADGASAEVEQENAPKEPEHPYEHLFQKILPSVMSPLESRTLPSPHLLLDLCLMKAANLHPPKSKSEEINVLKGHIELLHGQLLFERHRREAHAHRNRRLALKCRKTVTLEEQNNTMGQKIHNLEKEIASLKKEVTIQRNVGLVKERELLNTIEGLEGKLERHKKDISILIQDKSHLESKFSLLQEEFSVLQKESDQKKADFFSLENEVKNCQKYIERNKELKTAYEARLKEILVLGELLRRYKEITTPPSECGYLVEQMEACRQTHDEEIRGLRTLLETVMSQQEASNGTISDLKKRLEKREAIIELQRKDMQEKEQEHHLQLHALETKYESIKATNNRLELEILSLQHQISLKTVNTRPTRGRITSSSPSNNGEVSPAGNSNHSDVDSAASAGGFQMSPERNMCIFGSPQFDPPSEEMKDLQAVLDKESAGAIAAASSRRRNSSPLTHSRGDRI